MTTEKRLEIIASEIKIAEKDLLRHAFFTGAGFHTDVYKLPSGRKVQIEVTINADEDDFEDASSAFLENKLNNEKDK